jgi:DNA invertase Pin-like site-specific DNA recombinase
MKIGYARVSTDQQTNDPQTDRLNEAGCKRVFVDVMTGKAASRPEWDKLLDQLRAGDVLVILRFDRIGRSLKHLIDVVNDLHEREVGLLVLDQDINTTTPAGKFMFHIFGAVAEFERDLIRERTMDGLASARARGRTGGRKPKLNERQVATLKSMYAAVGDDGKRAFTVAEIAEAVRVHRTTVYDYLKASA